MANKYVEEAPYHPGYEDVGFKGEISGITVEIDAFRKNNSRYLNFADVIVDFCISDHKRLHSTK